MKNLLKDGTCSAVVNLQSPPIIIAPEGTPFQYVPQVTFRLSIETPDAEVPMNISKINLELPEDIKSLMTLPASAPFFSCSYDAASRVISITPYSGDNPIN